MSTEAEAILARIQSGQYAHLIFLAGSVISSTGESACATVSEYRSDLIIEGIVRRLSDRSSQLESSLHAFFAQLTEGNNNAFRTAVEKLPFEQFISCLDRVAPDAACEIVRIGCRALCNPFRPNLNHRAIVQFALAVLSGGHVREITILTTNYDLGLDQAMCEISDGKLERIEKAPFPAYKCLLPGGMSIRYGKLHGCIREPASLVYTFERLTDSILRPEGTLTFLRNWLPADLYSLLFAVGYGFNDPDLRPIFEGLFSPNILEAIRTERPIARSSNADNSPQLDPDRFYGTDLLREETLSHLKVITYPTDLHATDQNNLLLEIEALMSGRQMPAKSSQSCKFPTDEARTYVQPLLSSLTLVQLTRFAAGLAQACYRDDASGLLELYMKNPSWGPIDAILADSYLEQFGHRHGMQDLERASKQIRRLRHGIDIKVCGFAYESFAIFMGGHRGEAARIILPLLPLFWGNLLILCCSEDARHRFLHYESHYWLKLFQQIGQRLTPRKSYIYQIVIRHWADRIALKFNRSKRIAESRNDARRVAEAADLLAQALLLAGAHEPALQVSENAQRMASAQNAFHLALSCDRTTGWCLLASGNPSHEAHAVRVFARGLLRSTYAHDKSWISKLGVNLIRAAQALPEIRTDLNTLQLKPVEAATLLHALGRLAQGKLSDDQSRADIKLVTEWVLANCNNPKKARSAVDRYKDTKLHPVFLFYDNH